MRHTPGSPPPDLLAAIAHERARLLAPLLFVAMVSWFIALTTVARAPAITAIQVAMCTVVGIVALLVRRPRSSRWGHALLAVLWSAPVASTLAGQWSASGSLYAMLLPLEIVGAVVLLDTRWVIGSLVVTQAIWIPLSLRGSALEAAIYTMAALTAMAFAIAMQITLRRALLLHATTAAELKHQLEDRIRLEAQLLHAQRMEAIGTLAAGLAHDMNNVLGSITSFASLLEGEVQTARGRADLDQIVAQSMRGAELTRGLLAFSQAGKYRKHVVRIDDIVREVLPILERTLPRSIQILHQLDGGSLCVEGDPVQLGQVLVNLGLNAADAMAGRGTLTVTAQAVTLDAEAARDAGLTAGRHARFVVTDTGVGMDDATRERMFEPFFSTKPAGQGTGLGLSTVWGVVQSHHGAVSVVSRLGHGATFTILLPVVVATTPTRSIPVIPRLDKVQRIGTVLVVDDEPAVRAGTSRILERIGLTTVEARDGEEALVQLRAHAPAFDLVILDMGMPVMGGAECFRQLRALSQVPVLIATGYAVDAEVQDLVARGAALIEKPYPSADLVRAVTRILDA
ncbi:MAG: response regulator [Deltaproteobacteria bacterium]|nr:response regulator [Deltaproteobacteria bacterium]